MTVTAPPPLSDVLSTRSSHAEQVEHFREAHGCNDTVAEALYVALRLQEKGKVEQAIVYYAWVLHVKPDCQLAQQNRDILVTINAPEVHEVITAALDAEEEARRQGRQAEEAAARLAAEEEARRQEEEARRQATADAEARRAADERARQCQQATEERARQRQQAKEDRERKLREELSTQFCGMNLSKIRLEDVRRGEGGKLVCRSAIGSDGVGIGWRGYTYIGGESGQAYDSRKRSPEPCYNCGQYHFRRFCPYGQ